MPPPPSTRSKDRLSTFHGSQSKRRASLIQSVYMDDIERSSPRFEERFECVGRSYYNNTAICQSPEQIEQHSRHGVISMFKTGEGIDSSKEHAIEIKNKGRLITRHLTGLPATKNEGVSVQELLTPSPIEQSCSTQKKGVFKVRGTGMQTHIQMKTMEENEKSVSKISQEPERTVLQPVLQKNESKYRQATSDSNLDCSSVSKIQSR